MQPVKIAVIGAGQSNIATSNHLPAIEKSEKVELVALCDINNGVDEYAATYGVKSYYDFDSLLEDKSVEAVLIATPDWLHMQQCVDAANAGKHILCEKPVALSIDEFQQIKMAAEKNNIIFMAGHVRRFTPLLQTIKSIIDSGELGSVVYIRIGVKGAFFPYSKGSLYYKKETGGQFVHNGPHLADALCMFAGDRVATVNLVQRSYYPNPEEAMETPNYSLATVRFNNGVIGCIEQNLTVLAPRGYPYQEIFEVIGTKCTLNWNTHDDAVMLSYCGGSVSFSDKGIADGIPTAFLEQINHFADCIRNVSQPETGLDTCNDVMKICLSDSLR